MTGGGRTVEEIEESFIKKVEQGMIQAQKNGKGVFVGCSQTLLSSDYKQPPLVIEKRKELNNEQRK